LYGIVDDPSIADWGSQFFSGREMLHFLRILKESIGKYGVDVLGIAKQYSGKTSNPVWQHRFVVG